jgi:hypothetical protein
VAGTNPSGTADASARDQGPVPIRQAIDAAVLAAGNATDPDGSSPSPTARVVAAVAAFLRSVAGFADGAHLEFNGDETVWTGNFTALADAIEKECSGG